MGQWFSFFCHSAEGYFFIQLKKIYAENDFDDYKTEEEEVSKVIRCIINFFEDEPELIKF